MEDNCRHYIKVEQTKNTTTYYRCQNKWTHVFERDGVPLIHTCEWHKDYQKYWTIIDGVVTFKYE